MRAMIVMTFAAALIGCLGPQSVTCADQSVCPNGTKCIAEVGCVPEDCGNNVQNSGEACDDGNNLSGDACSADCRLPSAPGFCGDLQIDEGEACEPPNQNSCSSDCSHVYVCGDGLLDPGEVCDPPNRDGCNSDCTHVYECGDGTLDPGEECDDGDLRSRDGCSSSCRLEYPRWLRTSTAPSPRLDAAVVFDRDRGKLVLFGGCIATLDGNQRISCGALLADTWEWDGVVWERVGVQLGGPAGRSAAGMAYDSKRKRVVMFGGYQSAVGGMQFDTWEWDGTRWISVSSSGPPGRAYAAMTYDEVRHEVILAGGCGGATTISGCMTDTWSWNGTQWTQRAATSPFGTLFPMMAFDPTLGRVVAFTGYSLSSWDGTNWIGLPGTQMPTESRSANLMWFDPRRGLVVAGGCRSSDLECASPLTDIWDWTGTTWSQRNETLPPLVRPRAVQDVGLDRTLVFGGLASGVATNELRESSSNWRTRTERPASRLGAAMTYDVDRAAIVMFGGEGGSGLLGDLWEWTGEKWRERVVTSGPAPRRNASIAYHPGPVNALLLFGGRDAVAHGDTWMLGDTWTELSTTLSPRSEAAMTYAPNASSVVLDGGLIPLSDFPYWWYWSGSSWSRGGGLTPPPRAGAVMAYVPGSRVLWMIGGQWEGNNEYVDWYLNSLASAWDDPTTRSPIAAYASAAADPLRDAIVVFGGRTTSGTTSGDTWELTHYGDWTQLATALSPPARSEGVMAYDPHRRQTVMFGGALADGSLDAETWIFRIEAASPRDERCVDGMDGDGDGLVGCADPDCAGTCNPSSVVLGAASNTAFCGDLMCGPHETCGLCPGDCGECGLCGDGICDTIETCSACPGDCGACP